MSVFVTESFTSVSLLLTQMKTTLLFLKLLLSQLVSSAPLPVGDLEILSLPLKSILKPPSPPSSPTAKSVLFGPNDIKTYTQTEITEVSDPDAAYRAVRAFIDGAEPPRKQNIGELRDVTVRNGNARPQRINEPMVPIVKNFVNPYTAKDFEWKEVVVPKEKVECWKSWIFGCVQ